jgi:hypothetical protein
MPFERFRVVVDAQSGHIRSIELLSIYITESGSVFLPPQIPTGSGPVASDRTDAAALPPDRASFSRVIALSPAHAPPPFGWNALRVCSAAR